MRDYFGFWGAKVMLDLGLFLAIVTALFVVSLIRIGLEWIRCRNRRPNAK